ncbi:MAG: NfeD family protein [Firmicutes bacterium]|nr:NfeD family protein [Bacillota bacterium]
MEMTAVIWLAGIAVFAILEALTYQIVSVWFALGAVGGLTAAILGAQFNVQITVFLIISVVCLICLRPLSRKLIKTKKEKTNVDSLIGKEVLITEDVNNLLGNGAGKINGLTWSVKSADNSQIAANETAVVEGIAGVKLVVKRKEVIDEKTNDNSTAADYSPVRGVGGGK